MSLPEAFLDPASVAVVGATDDHAKWGYWLASGALKGAERRDVWLVNRRAGTVLGHPAHRSITDLPAAPELVVLCVPAAHVRGVVEEALAKGSRAFLAITAGVEDQAEIVALLAAADARMLGPNSLGMYDADADLQLAWGDFAPGPLAIVSQSGQLGSEIAALGERAGLGVSRFYSVGNQADLTAAELLEGLVDHERTKIVSVYLESFTDGVRLVAAMRALRQAGKHVLVLTTGASEGSKRLAQSHTGSLTSSADLVDAACRAAGALRVSTPRELVDLARFLSVAGLPGSRRLAVISDSGGQGGIAADVAASLGLTTPEFSPELQARLRALLPAGAAVSNPVDLAGAGEADLDVYAVVSEELANSAEVDIVLVSGYLGCYGEDSPPILERELAVVDRLGVLADSSHVPMLVHSMSAGSRAVTRMWEHHIPAFDTVDAALRAAAGVARLAAEPGRDLKVPQAVPASVGEGYWAARDLLADLGVGLPDAVVVHDPADLAAAAGLRYPVVLKAGWLEHKSEHGGVRIGLSSPEELADAFAEMFARLGDGEYVVEEQDTRRGVVEMLIGARRDRDFGPTILLGYGGVEAELWRDVRTELAPVDRATATAMVEQLRSRALLDGWRGKPRVDVEGLVEAVVTVSEAIASSPQLTDIEINPVRVAPDGVIAVDALVLHAAPLTAATKEEP
ncbi:CoA-binding protein [Aeromicrobium phragmitis]|uniref:CoA-binding protein n=1 Tax=Aeromicrobium phragmitis TaxID=2478914 RepID=A0A3L8PPV8_9ACTN|nr:acetate--CoA ligase family protein [Aeromicrobium phragmitis]RLV57416.1 CoA-binding protein [Aeromicrobium phragmitis]